MSEPIFTGRQLESAVIESIKHFVTVISNDYLDHKCKVDFIFTPDGRTAIVVQVKWNGGMKKTYPVREKLEQEREFLASGWCLTGMLLVEILGATVRMEDFMPAQFVLAMVQASDSGHNLLKVDARGQYVDSRTVDMEVYCG